jgi:hypothetical protein
MVGNGLLMGVLVAVITENLFVRDRAVRQKE